MSTSALPNQPKRVAGGGGPPYDDSMDRRLTILDTRFDTMLPMLATKHDVDLVRAEVQIAMENLRVEVAAQLSRLIKWMIGLHISLLLAIMGNQVLMFNVIRQFAPAQASAPTSAPAVAPRPNLDPIQRP